PARGRRVAPAIAATPLRQLPIAPPAACCSFDRLGPTALSRAECEPIGAPTAESQSPERAAACGRARLGGSSRGQLGGRLAGCAGPALTAAARLPNVVGEEVQP